MNLCCGKFYFILSNLAGVGCLFFLACIQVYHHSHTHSAYYYGFSVYSKLLHPPLGIFSFA